MLTTYLICAFIAMGCFSSARFFSSQSYRSLEGSGTPQRGDLVPVRVNQRPIRQPRRAAPVYIESLHTTGPFRDREWGSF